MKLRGDIHEKKNMLYVAFNVMFAMLMLNE